MFRIQDGSSFWRGFGLVTLCVLAVLVAYTLVVWYMSPGTLLEWLNTLVATATSVISAILVGLGLFKVQARQTEKARRSQLTDLLKIELEEVKRNIESSKSSVPDEALQTTRTSIAAYEMSVYFYHAVPLVVKDAARSGLFDEEATAEMMALTRNMLTHNQRIQEYMTAHPDDEPARPSPEQPVSERWLMAQKRQAEAGRSVERSEDRILRGCRILLDSLTQER